MARRFELDGLTKVESVSISKGLKLVERAGSSKSCRASALHCTAFFRASSRYSVQRILFGS